MAWSLQRNHIVRWWLISTVVLFSLCRVDLLANSVGCLFFFLNTMRVIVKCRQPVLPGDERAQSLTLGFGAQVRQVADSVLLDTEDDPTAAIALPSKCIFRLETRGSVISDKKTNQTLVDGDVIQANISLAFEQESNGWIIQGNGTGAGGNFNVVEGFVTKSGKAYWHEVSKVNEFVVVGHFQDDSSFAGEWLSNRGTRGQYSMNPIADSGIEIASGLPVSVPSSSTNTIEQRRGGSSLEIKSGVVE